MQRETWSENQLFCSPNTFFPFLISALLLRLRFLLPLLLGLALLLLTGESSFFFWPRFDPELETLFFLITLGEDVGYSSDRLFLKLPLSLLKLPLSLLKLPLSLLKLPLSLPLPFCLVLPSSLGHSLAKWPSWPHLKQPFPLLPPLPPFLGPSLPLLPPFLGPSLPLGGRGRAIEHLMPFPLICAPFI